MSDDMKRDRETVVSLPQMESAASQFPMIGSVETYWDSLRGDRRMPTRSEIDPRGLDRALSRCFILERLAPTVARFRLAGTHLNDLLGMEVRGMPLTAMFLPDARKQVSDALEQVFDSPARALLTLSGDRGIGKPPMDAALLLLPLMSDLGEVTRILGCLPTLGPIGRTPRRFTVRQSRVLPILHGEGGATEVEGWPERPDPRPDRNLETVLDGLAEPSAEYTPQQAPRSPRPPRQDKPHLYLVSSNDARKDDGPE
ncbi:PAS domain-containing protein [Tropicimonas marinistellae]|uniref:PAS domain-containing protein n=1 Tax=Tropicimonas marinistellae TaxID=1739787 RepID=UPI000832A581|nr:PAS domain-containing protein [Tropicimonas marinistellae]